MKAIRLQMILEVSSAVTMLILRVYLLAGLSAQIVWETLSARANPLVRRSPKATRLLSSKCEDRDTIGHGPKHYADVLPIAHERRPPYGRGRRSHGGGSAIGRRLNSAFTGLISDAKLSAISGIASGRSLHQA